MADPKARESGSNDYSASKAPDIQESAHNSREHDYRAIPGGHPSRATAMYGMESLEREDIIDTNPGQTGSAESRQNDRVA